MIGWWRAHADCSLLLVGVTESHKVEERSREGKRDEVVLGGRFACLHAHISMISNAFWVTRERTEGLQ